MSHVHEYNHMKESYYGGGFIHKTLNILQSYPCSSCQSWFSSGSRPVEGFITQIQQNKKRLFVVYIVLCVLCMLLFYDGLMDPKESSINHLKKDVT